MIFDFMAYDRIILVGSGSSGKSWLSKRISEITGYPLFHLDKEFWQPGWVMLSREEKIAKQKEMMERPTWIIDGNYESTMEIRFATADLVIFLDINRFVCATSVIRRTGQKRSDLPDYLVEPKIFSKDFYDFFKWIWSYPKKGRKMVMMLHEKYSDKMFLHIKKRRHVNKLLSG